MASIEFSETNGSGGVVTDGIGSIQFASVDQPSVAGVSTSYKIAPGGYSYEKWIRAKVTAAAATGFTAFSVYFDNAVLDSASGNTIAIKYGVNHAYATPVVTPSTVATSAISGDTTSPGTGITPPGAAIGALSAYLTLQAFVGSGAPGGSASFPPDFLSLLFAWN